MDSAKYRQYKQAALLSDANGFVHFQYEQYYLINTVSRALQYGIRAQHLPVQVRPGPPKHRSCLIPCNCNCPALRNAPCMTRQTSHWPRLSNQPMPAPCAFPRGTSIDPSLSLRYDTSTQPTSKQMHTLMLKELCCLPCPTLLSHTPLCRAGVRPSVSTPRSRARMVVSASKDHDNIYHDRETTKSRRSNP